MLDIHIAFVHTEIIHRWRMNKYQYVEIWLKWPHFLWGILCFDSGFNELYPYESNERYVSDWAIDDFAINRQQVINLTSVSLAKCLQCIYATPWMNGLQFNAILWQLVYTNAFLCHWKFPAQRASNAENVSIWWRHHVLRDIARTDHVHTAA